MSKKKQPDQNQESDAFHHAISAEDLAAAREEARRQMQGHAWRQRGTEVYCESCPFSHAFYLPPGMILQGTDEDGKPILTKVKFQ